MLGLFKQRAPLGQFPAPRCGPCGRIAHAGRGWRRHVCRTALRAAGAIRDGRAAGAALALQHLAAVGAVAPPATAGAAAEQDLAIHELRWRGIPRWGRRRARMPARRLRPPQGRSRDPGGHPGRRRFSRSYRAPAPPCAPIPSCSAPTACNQPARPGPTGSVPGRAAHCAGAGAAAGSGSWGIRWESRPISTPRLESQSAGTGQGSVLLPPCRAAAAVGSGSR